MAAAAQRQVYAFEHWEVDLARAELRANGVVVPIGGRAFEILAVLVQSAGGLVTKEDLMARVWPGMVVEDNTLQVHISAVRKALAVDREILKTASGRGYRLLGNWTLRDRVKPSPAIDRLPQSSPAAPARTHRSRNNLPLAGPDVIGRMTAVQRVQDLLSAYRVVTLTGPGGIGKTRLALEVARHLLPDFADGVWLVELASLSDPALVMPAVAGALGLALSKHEISPEDVAQALRERTLLLVLDNCEHVIEPAAMLVEAMMRMCPNTSVLSTSQELLRIDGECSYRVLPLDVPPQSTQTPDDILQHSAVQLFIARTKSLNPGFAPSEPDLLAIAAICRRLDGIPLAIEFAAARAATLGFEQVVSGLDDRFSLLTGGRRTALPRHRTLRAMLDWSHDLLIETERVILRRLAVFTGSFTLEAACAVLATPEITSHDVIDAIHSLAAKSLVVLDNAAHPMRYMLLETVRAYGLEKLAEAAETGLARRCHASYFQDLFEQAEAEWPTRRLDDWLATYRRELDNVRSALDWAVSPGGDQQIAVTLSSSATRLMFDLSLVAECRRRAEQALALINSGVQADPRREMLLLAVLQATDVYIAGPSIRSREGWQRVLEIATRLDDFDYQARAIWGLWNDYTYGGMPADSLIFARRFLDHVVTGNEPWRVVLGRRIVGISLHYYGDQIAARPHLDHVLAHYVHGAGHPALGSRLNNATVARATLARVLWLQGEPDQALRVTDQAMQQATGDDHLMSILYVLVEAAVPLSLLTGDVPGSQRFLDTLLEQASRSSFLIWQTYGRCFQAMLLALQDHSGVLLAKLTDAIQELQASGFREHQTMFLGALANLQDRTGKHSEAMLTLDTALHWCERHGERWFIAELLRIKATILARQTADAEATQHFRQSLDWARQQGARAWELRTATSFAQHLRRQHCEAEAQTLLATVYDQFTEGFETADLRAARSLLQTLSRT